MIFSHPHAHAHTCTPYVISFVFVCVCVFGCVCIHMDVCAPLLCRCEEMAALLGAYVACCRTHFWLNRYSGNCWSVRCFRFVRTNSFFVFPCILFLVICILNAFDTKIWRRDHSHSCFGMLCCICTKCCVVVGWNGFCCWLIILAGVFFSSQTSVSSTISLDMWTQSHERLLVLCLQLPCAVWTIVLCLLIYRVLFIRGCVCGVGVSLC